MSRVETSIPELKPLQNVTGKFSAYCGVCWLDVYRLWVDKASPDYSRCPMGDYTAQTCPNAIAHARNTAMIAKLKADGLWPDPRPSPKETGDV